MFVACNKHDGIMSEIKNWCEEIGFPIVCLHYIRIKVYLSRKRNKRWK